MTRFPVLDAPPVNADGDKVKETKVGGVMVSVFEALDAPYETPIATVDEVETTEGAVMLKAADVAPAGTVTVEATVARLESDDDRVINAPPTGAAPFRYT